MRLIRHATPHLRRLLAIALPAGGLLCLAGICFRDRTPAMQWLFFIPPLPVSLALVFGALAVRERSVWWRTLALLLAGLLAHKVLAVDTRWRRTAAAEADTIRVLHWNIARGLMGYDALFAQIRRDRPELLILSEVGHAPDLAERIRTGTGLPFVNVSAGMALASQYLLIPRGPIPLISGRAWEADVLSPRGTLRVALVDVSSRPSLDRRQPALGLAEWLARVPTNQALLVAGDFNTPRDALALTPLRGRLRHAYEESGSGWPYSWPLPLPCYHLDHVWVGGPVRSVGQRYRWSLRSDHLRQELQVVLEKRKGGSGSLVPPPPFPGRPRP